MEEKVVRVPPAYSYEDIAKKGVKTLPFKGDWLRLIGEPELTGCWIIWGLSGNGKTRFALQLAKYLASFQKVFYNTLEEGVSLSFKKALEANHMQAVGNKFTFYQDDLKMLKARLRKQRSPNIIFIDSPSIP